MVGPHPAGHLTRREALVRMGGLALAASAATGAAKLAGALDLGSPGLPRPAVATDPQFVTRPDLRIPGLTVEATASGLSGGLLMFAPYNAPSPAQAGAVIVDEHGTPVWEQPLAGLVTTDLRVQTYRGAPALTWWEGLVRLGHGVGRYVIADSAYRPLARVRAGNGRRGDLHEFLLTDRGTALLTTYSVAHADLCAVGGARDGTIQDAIFQEVDLASGRVLLEWHSLDHIPISESYWPVGENWDYVHLNSIAVDHDNNLLVSSRNTHTIYKIDRHTGQIIWRLGGKHTNFPIPPNARFAWQHDARRQPNGTLTLFDNGNQISRALILHLDEPHRTTQLQHAYQHPNRLFANSQGNVQILPNHNILVGWGAQPYISEFTPNGSLAYDAHFDPGYISYRAYRVPWAAAPRRAPDVAVRRSRGATVVYVSWNGDSRVRTWTVLAGPSGSAIAARGVRTGFETVMRVPARLAQLRVRGHDANGAVLVTSAAVTA